jgi:hypothetical protein
MKESNISEFKIFRRKWVSYFRAKRKNMPEVYYKRGDKMIRFYDFTFFVSMEDQKLFFDDLNRLDTSRGGKKRKFYISENLKDAAWKWWDTKGQIPADDIAKEFQIGTKELTLYLQAQIFQQASTGTLSDNPDFFNAYYEAYYGKPSEQHFF